jgi:hypothetical protein
MTLLLADHFNWQRFMFISSNLEQNTALKFAGHFAGQLLTVAPASYLLRSQPFCHGGESTAKNKETI